MLPKAKARLKRHDRMSSETKLKNSKEACPSLGEESLFGNCHF